MRAWLSSFFLPDYAHNSSCRATESRRTLIFAIGSLSDLYDKKGTVVPTELLLLDTLSSRQQDSAKLSVELILVKDLLLRI